LTDCDSALEAFAMS